jgi:hypothetical protein
MRLRVCASPNASSSNEVMWPKRKGVAWLWAGELRAGRPPAAAISRYHAGFWLPHLFQATAINLFPGGEAEGGGLLATGARSWAVTFPCGVPLHCETSPLFSSAIGANYFGCSRNTWAAGRKGSKIPLRSQCLVSTRTSSTHENNLFGSEFSCDHCLRVQPAVLCGWGRRPFGLDSAQARDGQQGFSRKLRQTSSPCFTR